MNRLKKTAVLLCFFASAACLISAGLYMNKLNAGLADGTVYDPLRSSAAGGEPELLSDIRMTSYVSLPASFTDISVVEDLDEIEVTEDNVDDVMYDQLFKTAKRASALNKDGLTMVIDYTVTKDNSVQEISNGVTVGYSSSSDMYDSTVYEGLSGTETGASAHLEGVTFNGVSGAVLDITVNEIYDMPYPVTDSYISENTEYDSVYGMRMALLTDASGEAKETARAHTINSLIDTMMEQTTFIKLPESLIQKELEAIQKETPEAVYSEAKHSLYKIFFIAAVIDRYGLATKSDMDSRFAALSDEEKAGMTAYEEEREKYLLYEQDVVIYIYKNITVTESA